MSKRKIQISKSAILKLITENASKIKNSDLQKMIAENTDLQKLLAENDAETGSSTEEPVSGLDGMIGGEEDRKIQYPENPGIESPDDTSAGDKPAEFAGGLDSQSGAAMAAKLSKSAPSQLLDYLEKLEEAKSILSKVAAGETDQEVKSKIYSHYEKVQKTAFEMIKEFGIVH